MWKNSDEFLLLSVCMLYDMAELIPEMCTKSVKSKQTRAEKEQKNEEMRNHFYIDAFV